jgi:vitamin B12 transporter
MRVPALALAVATFGVSPLSAQSQGTSSKDTVERARTLDGMVVTATRSSTATRDLPQKVEVISRSDIEQTPATDLTEILKRLSTADVVQYPSLLSGIGIRGFRPETGSITRRTQVLIDGRPAGTGNLSTLPLDNVERIEIVKGATSSLYGSGGMGGTINVITRKSRGPLKVNASALYGSFQTTNFSFHTGGNLTSRLDFDLSGNDYRLGEDFKIGKGGLLRKAFGSKSSTKLGTDTTWNIPDIGDGIVRTGSKFGYRNGSARIGYELGGGMRADVSGELFKATRVRTPGEITDGDNGNGLKDVSRNGFDITISGVRGLHIPRVRFFSAYEDSDTYNDTTGANNFISFAGQTRTQGFQAQDVVHVGRHTVTVGIDYTRATETSNRKSDPTTFAAPFSPNARNAAVGVFVQNHWRALDNRLTGTIGGRLDRITLHLLETPLLTSAIAGKRSFTAFNPSIGVQYRTTENIRFHTSLGRAFVAPEARQMAGQSLVTGPAITLTAGNPNLRPETSVTFDVGAGYTRAGSGFDVDFTYFHTRISNRITSVLATFEAGSYPTLSDGREVASAQTYVNANYATMHGVETELSYDFGVLTGRRYILRAFTKATRIFSANEYTRIVTANSDEVAGKTDFDAADVLDVIEFGAKTKTRVRNVAPLTVTTGLEYNSLGRWSGRLTGRYVGSRMDLDFSVAPVSDILYAPFAVIDAMFGVQVTPNYRIDALVNNLTDENYYEKRGFNLPGRTLQLRVSVTR